MTKLVIADNRTNNAFILENDDCKADTRTLMMGRNLVLGQHNQGVDIPSGANPVIRITGPNGRPVHTLCDWEGAPATVVNGQRQKLPGVGGKSYPRSDTIAIEFDEQGMAWRPATMPALAVPKITHVYNALTESLRFANLETAADDVAKLAPDAWTPTPGQHGQGVDIPECRGRDSWGGRRLRLAPAGDGFEINIYRVGYDIFWSMGPGYPVVPIFVHGGQSQGDGRAKALVVLAKDEIMLVDVPADFATWVPPLPDHTFFRADVDLMVDYREEGGALKPENVYVTRIEMRSKDGRVRPRAEVYLTAEPATVATVNGDRTAIPKLGNESLGVFTDASGVITISHPAATLGAPTFRVTIAGKHGVPGYSTDVHPAERVARKLEGLRTDDDWRKARGRDGALLVPPGTPIPKGAGPALRDLLLTTTSLPVSRSRLRAGAPAPARVQVAGLAHVAPADGPARPLNLDHLPEGVCWGLVADGAESRYVTGDEALQLLQSIEARGGARRLAGASAAEGATASGWWPAIGEWFSEAWSGFKTFVCKVVNGVLTFFVDLAGELFELAVTVVSEVFQALSWLMSKAFGLTMDKIVAWLGEAFDWPSIAASYRQIRGLATQAPEALATGLASLHTMANKWLASGPGSLVAALREDRNATRQGRPPQFDRPGRTDAAPQQGGAFNSPALRWAGDKLTGSVGASTALALPDLPDLFEGVGEHLAKLEALVKASFEKLQKNYDTMSFSDIVDLVLDTASGVFAELVETLFAVLEGLARGLGASIRSFLDTPAPQIPILSQLYAQHIDPNKNWKLIDLCSFLLAIPASIVGGALLGRPPAGGARLRRGATDGVSAAAGGPDDQVALAASDQIATGGVIASVCQLESAVMTAIVDGLRMFGGTPKTVRVLLSFKLLTDVIGFGASMWAVGAYAAANQDRSPREEIDIFVATYQVVFRIKDFARIYTFDAQPSAGVCGVIETVAGLLYLPVLCAGIGLQAQEAAPRVKELPAKGVQLLALAAAQAMSWPREEALILRRAQPETLPLEALVVGARLALLVAVPAAGFARTKINYDEKLPFAVVS